VHLELRPICDCCLGRSFRDAHEETLPEDEPLLRLARQRIEEPHAACLILPILNEWQAKHPTWSVMWGADGFYRGRL
jgi:hypothetical protein